MAQLLQYQKQLKWREPAGLAKVERRKPTSPVFHFRAISVQLSAISSKLKADS
jgi:hypothetical protein